MIEPGDLVEIIDPVFGSYGTVGRVVEIWDSGLYDLSVDIPGYGPTALRYSEVRLVS